MKTPPPAPSPSAAPSSRKTRPLPLAADAAREIARLRQRLIEESERRRRAERRRQMLELALETMETGVTLTDGEGRILYVNQAAARMHGYAVEELVGEPSSRFAGRSAPLGVGYEPQEPWTRERVNLTKDGETFPVLLTSRRLSGGDGQPPLATATVCEDLRERKKIDQALAGRDRILEALGLTVERFLAGSSWEEGVEAVLERLGRATGVDLIYIALIRDLEPFAPERILLSWETPGGSLEKTFSERLGLQERMRVFASWEDSLRRGRVLQGRVDELPPDERQALEACGVRSFLVVPIFVEAELKGYLVLEDGDPERQWSSAELGALETAARAVAVSIRRQESEKALQASEEKYRDLLENATDLIQSVSPDGHFQYVNRVWRETLGYDHEEVETLMLWDVVEPALEEGGDPEVVQSILTGDDPGPLEALFVTRDGRRIPVEGRLSCRYVDGLPAATRGIFRDVTERKRAERVIRDFISTVSHELRTPLTSIIASLGLLESGHLEKPERSSELLSVARRNSNRLLELINNLLDLQKLAAGKLTFRSETVEPGALLSEAIEDILAFAQTRKIELCVEPVEPGLRLVGDRDRLLQVLDNLLSNAIKFSPEGERVTLAADAHGDCVRLTVADRGPGIPEEFRSRLFEKFAQLDSRHRSGGSGLGLSIARGMIEGMGGTIRLDLEVERGSTFHVDLPRALTD